MDIDANNDKDHLTVSHSIGQTAELLFENLAWLRSHGQQGMADILANNIALKLLPESKRDINLKAEGEPSLFVSGADARPDTSNTGVPANQGTTRHYFELIDFDPKKLNHRSQKAAIRNDIIVLLLDNNRREEVSLDDIDGEFKRLSIKETKNSITSRISKMRNEEPSLVAKVEESGFGFYSLTGEGRELATFLRKKYRLAELPFGKENDAPTADDKPKNWRAATEEISGIWEDRDDLDGVFSDIRGGLNKRNGGNVEDTP